MLFLIAVTTLLAGAHGQGDCETGVTYRCGDDVNGYCIPIEERCDGVQDCTNGEDEVGCPSNSPTCGQQVIDPILAPPNGSVGGYEAVPGSWPWMASIQESFEHKCGATILDNRWVLTAATCIYLFRNNPQVVNVVSGNHVYTQPDPYETIHDVESIHIHPSYAPLKDDYNFALLKITGTILFFNDWHLDICLPVQDDNYSNGTATYITGFGDSISGSSVLLQQSIVIYDRDYCNDPSRWNGDVTPSLICGEGTGGEDACNGDDGGPMMYYMASEDRYYLVGVIGDRVTHGCAVPNKPGLYGYVPNVITWIEDTMINN